MAKMKRYRIFYRKAPAWLVGEDEKDAWPRRKSRGTGVSSQWYPGDYAGKVIAVLPVSNTGDSAGADEVELELTDEERSGLAGRTLKIAAGEPVPVTFDDRYGAAAQLLRDEFGDAEAVEAQVEQLASKEDATGGERELVERFGQVMAVAQKALAPTVFTVRGEAL